MEEDNAFQETVLPKGKTKHESGQISRSEYEFTGNIEDKHIKLHRGEARAKSRLWETA